MEQRNKKFIQNITWPEYAKATKDGVLISLDRKSVV